MTGLIDPQVVAEFDVAGIPRPQGSMRAFLHKHTHRVVLTSSNTKELTAWREALREGAKGGRHVAWQGPVRIGIVFRLPRPKSHVGARGLLPSAPHAMASKPDLDKLVRAVMDALTESGVITDDAVVTQLAAKKVYGEPGCAVRVVAETTP